MSAKSYLSRQIPRFLVLPLSRLVNTLGRMNELEARAALDFHMRTNGHSYTSLSRVLGRNPAYIQQYVRRGVPRALDADDRRRIARHLGIAPSLIGEPEDAAQPVAALPSHAVAPTDYVRVAALDPDAATFGLAFHAGWVGELASGQVDALAMLRVEGDAMLPTLVPGDHLVIDTHDAGGRLRDGLYALRLDGALMVKRLAINPATRLVTIASDNPSYPDWAGCDAAQLVVAGRVVWAGRRFL